MTLIKEYFPNGEIFPFKIITIIDRRKKNILTVTNGGLIKLFWEIGTLINHYFDQKIKEAPNKKLILKELSKYLSGEYGHYFEDRNLENMALFARKHEDPDRIRTLFPFVSWEHIILILRVTDVEVGIQYLEICATEGLSEDSLQKKISSNFIENTKLPNHNARLFSSNTVKAEKFTNKNIFNGKNAIINIFEEPTLTYLKPLFAPAKGKIKKIDQEKKSPTEKVLYDKISQLIYKFKSFHNSWVNENLNMCFWEIGQYLNQESFVTNFLPHRKKLSIEKARSLLDKRYDSIFTEKQLTWMCKFAEDFTDYGMALRMAKLISWKHIEVLLPLQDDKEKLFYARLTASKGLSISQLKNQIVQNTYGHIIGANELEQNLIDRLEDPKITNDQFREKNNTIFVSTMFIDFNDNLDSSLVVTNILKKPYLSILVK